MFRVVIVPFQHDAFSTVPTVTLPTVTVPTVTVPTVANMASLGVTKWFRHTVDFEPFIKSQLAQTE